MHRREGKGMKKPLPQPKKLVSISEAAQILGVSLDTIRRWDKTGLLHSERPDGKNRYFSLDELKAYKLNQPLTISEASYELHISPTTLRRLVKKGVINSIRNRAGERLFPKESITEFLASEYYSRRQTSIEVKQELSKKPKKAVKKPAADSGVTNTTSELQVTAADQIWIKKVNWQLVSGGLVAVVVFFLLTAIGITNIQISNVEASQITPVEDVAIQTQPFVVPLEPKVGRTKSLLNSVEMLPAKPASPTAYLKLGVTEEGLTYTVETASASAQPTATNSAIISSIDAFPIDSIDAQGYHIKLPDGSLGFIPFDKVMTEDTQP
jgi:excisionase family DNA binding protein